MARVRSPSYPSVSLKEAIDFTSKIFKENRTNAIDRESAVLAMGYSSLSGRALSILSSLLQYGLISKADAGEIKVTQLSVNIMHSVDLSDKQSALLIAAKSPPIFKELVEKFTDGIPSDNAIRSHLIQLGFADAALGLAIKSYTETDKFIKSETNETIVSQESCDEGLMQQTEDQNEGSSGLETASHSEPSTREPLNISQNLNEINMNIQGTKVYISALINYEGLLRLEKKIKGLKVLMEPDSIDQDE